VVSDKLLSSCAESFFDVAVGQHLLFMEINPNKKGTGYLMVCSSAAVAGVGILSLILDYIYFM